MFCIWILSIECMYLYWHTTYCLCTDISKGKGTPHQKHFTNMDLKWVLSDCWVCLQSYLLQGALIFFFNVKIRCSSLEEEAQNKPMELTSEGVATESQSVSGHLNWSWTPPSSMPILKRLATQSLQNMWSQPLNLWQSEPDFAKKQIPHSRCCPSNTFCCILWLWSRSRCRISASEALVVVVTRGSLVSVTWAEAPSSGSSMQGISQGEWMDRKPRRSSLRNWNQEKRTTPPPVFCQISSRCLHTLESCDISSNTYMWDLW